MSRRERPRQDFKPAVKRDAFLRAAGRCEGKDCGAKLTVGKFAYDHVLPDFLGGEPTLLNCQVLCNPCHKAKTRAEATERGKGNRAQDAHRGIRPAPKQPIRSAPMPKAAPQRSARLPDKPGLPPLARRPLFLPA